MTEADDRELGLDGELEVRRVTQARSEVRRQVVVVLDERGQSARAQVLPAHPKLQGAEAARALDRVLVPIQWLVLGTARGVVLGRPVERFPEILSPADDERADVVGLAEPLVWIDRHGVRQLQTGHAGGVARREPRGT